MAEYNGVAYRMRPDGQTQVCQVVLDEVDRILDSNHITCVFAGTARFDRWFRRHWDVAFVQRIKKRGKRF